MQYQSFFNEGVFMNAVDVLISEEGKIVVEIDDKEQTCGNYNK